MSKIILVLFLMIIMVMMVMTMMIMVIMDRLILMYLDRGCEWRRHILIVSLTFKLSSELFSSD